MQLPNLGEEIYYAHTSKSKDEKEILQDHLQECSKLCAAFAKSFNREDEGAYIGALHDIGKATACFQQVLQGKAYKINHAFPGAYYVYRCAVSGHVNYALETTLNVCADVIAAHHSELSATHKNTFFNRGLLTKEGKFSDKLTDFVCKTYSFKGLSWKDWCSRVSKVVKLDRLLNLKESPNFDGDVEDLGPDYNYNASARLKLMTKNINKMMFERFLSSCLTDADYSSTIQFSYPDYIKRTTSKPIDTDRLIAEITVYHKKLQENAVGRVDSRLCNIRDKVFEICTKRGAELTTGLYTLTAPTGSGKTISLLSFAAQQVKKNGKERIIIVLPYISIIEQNAEVYKQIYGAENVMEIHSNARFNLETADTGTCAALVDRWQSPIIVTTALTFFESFFKSKPKELRHLHQFANSVIVFDEAQCLPDNLLNTTITTLNGLCNYYNSTVLFSTATQPALQYKDGLEWNAIELCTDVQSLYNGANRVSVEWWLKEETSFKTITEKMLIENSCCTIVNTKRQALFLYELLKSKGAEGLYHISANMCPAHRTDVLAEIKTRLENKQPCRIVSTQCIEAGVDIDVEVMFRALAPLESIIQAAGRCNRNAMYKKGRLYVFNPEVLKGVSKYPSDAYSRGANILMGFYRTDAGKLDINSLESINLFYKSYYRQVKESKELEDAVMSENYAEVQRCYKFIDTKTYRIIIPYGESKGEYQLLKTSEDGVIEKDQLWGLSNITVSTTCKAETLALNCRRLSVQERENIVVTDFFILQDESLYSLETGLCI